MRLGDHCGKVLSDLSRIDPRIWVLDGDLADSDGAVHFARTHPDRFIMAGASEQCMVSMAAGMAACGLRPWVFSFAAFLCYRAYDQIRVCLSQARRPVTLVGSHSGGCGGRNGKTHLSLNDIGLIASLPDFQVWSPASPHEMPFVIQSIMQQEKPAYLRLPRLPVAELPGTPAVSRWLKPKSDLNLVCTGLGTHLALAAAETLRTRGVRSGLLHLSRVSPLPDQLCELLDSRTRVVVVEDHYTFGGLASLIKDRATRPVLAVGWPSSWPGKSGNEHAILESQKLGPEQICESVLEFLGPGVESNSAIP